MATITADPLELFVDVLVRAASRGNHELSIGYPAVRYHPSDALGQVHSFSATYCEGRKPFAVFVGQGDEMTPIGQIDFEVGYGRVEHGVTYMGKKPSDPENPTRVHIKVATQPRTITPYLRIEEDGLTTYLSVNVRTREIDERFGTDPLEKGHSTEELLKHIEDLEAKL